MRKTFKEFVDSIPHKHIKESKVRNVDTKGRVVVPFINETVRSVLLDYDGQEFVILYKEV